MKQFKIYQHPSGQLQAIKIGFSWPAFFFGFAWALVNKLWTTFFILVGMNLVFMIFNAILSYYSRISVEIELFSIFIALILPIAYSIFCGINGNDTWLSETALLNGFSLIGQEIAPNASMALAMHCNKNQKTSVIAAENQ